MILESIFMIRGGSHGDDFGLKLILSLIGIAICFYDYKTNDKRKDYFWVFLVGTIIWSMAELVLQLGGTRVLQQKFLFGINITNALWLTIPLQGMSEGAHVAVTGMLIGDRALKKETRNLALGFLILNVLPWALLSLPKGIHFNSVNVGDTSIPSRRDIFNLISVVFIIIMCAISIIWLVTTDSYARKRGIAMYLAMVSVFAAWTLFEWLTGQRWIEIGTVNSDGTYSNLRRAPPLIEFGALAYDVVIEVSLIYVPFLAIPYWLNLIKTEKQIKGKVKR